jgi:antitoxin ParD1/3/4
MPEGRRLPVSRRPRLWGLEGLTIVVSSVRFDGELHVKAWSTTRSVSLSPDLARQIEEQIEPGAYDSGDEVVRDALRALDAERQEYEAKLTALRSAVDVGIAEIERGEAIPGPLAMQQVKASSAA